MWSNLHINRKILSISVIVIIYFSISANTIIYHTHAQNDENFYINYKCDFFSLHLNNGSYYGGENHRLNLYINLYQDNSKEKIAIKLEILNFINNSVCYYIENRYNYDISERCIYTDTTLIGMIPIFIDDKVLNNQKVTIAKFNNKTLEGMHKEKDGYLIISEKKIEYHYVLIDDAEGTYTSYYYSDYENILIWWEIGNLQEITLNTLFNISDFYGHIMLEDTNFNIKWIEYSPIESIYPLIITTVILIVLILSFLFIFLLIRRKLKVEYNKRKRNIKNRRKKKGKYEKW